MIDANGLARAFSITAPQPTDSYRYSTVRKVNANGTVTVELAPSAETVCTCLYAAAVGDRVQVCIKANGSCVVVGKLR